MGGAEAMLNTDLSAEVTGDLDELADAHQHASTPLNVLCVDDDDADVALVVHALKDGGYAPRYRHVCGRTALIEALDSESWDIVISDYAMPQFNGVAALRIVKERDSNMPFILVSGA